VDARPVSVSLGSNATTAIAVGARVFHQKFGMGTVTGTDGGKLAIRFDQAGDKMVLDSFVTPAA
jgi:DNA helicase-2/ATP-dependent DNA helicase PcrA